MDTGHAPGALVRELRLAKGLSQHQLAVRAGTRQPTISRVENGHEAPTADRLRELLLVMGAELTLGAVEIDPGRPAADVAADRSKPMRRRLEEGFALASFATELAGAARR